MKYLASILLSVSLFLGLVGQALAIKYELIEVRRSELPLPLYEGNTVGQTFVVPFDNFNIIGIRFGNYGKQVDDTLVYRLHEGGPGGDLVYQTEIRTDGFADNQIVYLVMPPIYEAYGKLYYLEIESLFGKEDNKVAVWASSVDDYLDGQAFVNDLVQPSSDLNIEVSAEVDPWLVFKADIRQKLNDQSGFFSFYLLLVMVVAGVLYYQVFQKSIVKNIKYYQAAFIVLLMLLIILRWSEVISFIN